MWLLQAAFSRCRGGVRATCLETYAIHLRHGWCNVRHGMRCGVMCAWYVVRAARHVNACCEAGLFRVLYVEQA